MYIAFIDTNPTISGRSLGDNQHSLIREAAQCLSSALRLRGVETDSIYKPYAMTREYVKWAAETRANFMWLCDYATTAANDYARRTGETHKSASVLTACVTRANSIPEGPLTPCPLNFHQETPIEIPAGGLTFQFSVDEHRKRFDYKCKKDKVHWSGPNIRPRWL